MESDWSLDFCLACDKQTTEGAYCSQACRAADIHMAESHHHHSHSTGPSSPATSFSQWSFSNTSTGSASPPNMDFYTAYDTSSKHKLSEESSITDFSLDGIFFEGPAALARPSQSSSTFTASSPSMENKHFLADHVRQALKSYENMFDQHRRRKHSSAS